MNPISPELNLMAATENAVVICKLIVHCRNVSGEGLGARAIERPAYCDVEIVGNGRWADVDPEILRCKGDQLRFVDCRPIEGAAECVDHARAHNPGFTQSHR